MGAVRPVVVVEPLPFFQLGVEIDDISVGQELAILLLIRSVGSLDLSVQLRAGDR